ncbi:MAG: NosD domain-containing protein, partial [Candidatus Aenigmatarchaeota archaeon]
MRRKGKSILSDIVPLIVVFLALALVTNFIHPTPTALLIELEKTAEQPTPEMLPEELSRPKFNVPLIASGMYFQLNDSSFKNVSLSSTEPINVYLVAPPQMVEMVISSNSSSSQLTICGLNPNTEYHMYVGDYHNHQAFTTDSRGCYSWQQNLSEPRHIWIQPRPSTIFINNNATGGDCELIPIGTWNADTLTCTLNTSITQSIQIDSNGITLDCDGYSITGSNTGNGIYLNAKNDVKIRNCNVTSFTYGIFLYSSSNNTLTNNTAYNNNYHGILLSSSSNNTLTNNTAYNNNYGIYLYSSSNN